MYERKNDLRFVYISTEVKKEIFSDKYLCGKIPGY